MIIETDRFGPFELKDSKIIDFPLGLPGFEDLTKFIILEIKETRPVYWLQSTENKYISLPIIIPFEIIEDYFIEIRETEMQELSVESKNDLLIMNVVVIPEDIRKMTVNLAAAHHYQRKDRKRKTNHHRCPGAACAFPYIQRDHELFEGGRGPMLVLSRKTVEAIAIGQDVTLEIIAIEGDRVRVGIRAPKEIRIFRKELLDETININKLAVNTPPISFKLP